MGYWIAVGWVLSGMICLHVDYVLFYSTRTHPVAKMLEEKVSPWTAWLINVVVALALGPVTLLGLTRRSIRKSRHFALFVQQAEEADAAGERHPDEPTFPNDPNCIGCAVTFLKWGDDPIWAIASQSVMATMVAVALDGPEEIRRTLCEFHGEVLRLALDRNHVERAGEPPIYDCGCSRLKVRAGLCDVYGTDGKPITERPPEAS